MQGLAPPAWKPFANNQRVPITYDIKKNYPNPFNPITTIEYGLPEDSFVELRIFDIVGKEIRRLIVINRSAGFKSVLWDGKDNNGESVSSGIYIYRFNAKSIESDKSFSKTEKMILIR